MKTRWRPSESQNDQAIIQEGDQFIADAIGEAGLADVERKTQLFNDIAKDFSLTVGKVGSTGASFSTHLLTI